MTDAELRTWAEAHAPAGSPLAVGILRVLLERDGERKANALLNAGMGAVCEGRDELKHRVRELEAELADARRVCASLAERCAGQAELIAARASKDTTTQQGDQ